MIDAKAVKRYHKRRAERLKERGIRMDFDEGKIKRDKDGKFATKEGGGDSSPKQETGKQKAGKTVIAVNGPKQTKAYIDKYFQKHPEVKKEAKKYKGVLSNVRDFRKKFPNAEDEHSYDAVTGEPVDVTSGNCVTFHQNYKIGDEYGGYDDDTYAAMCAIAMNELKAERCYIGYFGNPEISFNCPDAETARRFAKEHNQHSVFNAETFDLWVNEDWDERTNPIKGKGSN